MRNLNLIIGILFLISCSSKDSSRAQDRIVSSDSVKTDRINVDEKIMGMQSNIDSASAPPPLSEFSGSQINNFS
jgi:uncharacterized protein YcfL